MRKDPRNGAELLPTAHLKHAPSVIPPARQPGGHIYHTGQVATADLVAPPPTPEQSPPAQGDAFWPPSLGSRKGVPQKDGVPNVHLSSPSCVPLAYAPTEQVKRAGAPSRTNTAAATARYAPSTSTRWGAPVAAKAVEVTELRNRRPVTLRDFLGSSSGRLADVDPRTLPVAPRHAGDIRGSEAVASRYSIPATPLFEASASAGGKTTVAPETSGCGGAREDPIQSSGLPAEPEDICDWVMLDAGACVDEGKKVVEVLHVPFFLFDADAQASPLLLQEAQDGDPKARYIPKQQDGA